MPAKYEVDITEMVAPKLQAAWKRGLAEGKLEGKLEAARGMLDAGAEIGFVIKATGLTRAELKQAGLVQRTED